MNIEIEKKEYVAPQMTIVEMHAQGSLLAGSDTSQNFIGSDDDEDTSYLD